MQLAIMQPYIFPYIGYFQLIHSVDFFIFYDDVNYIKGGWINRNYILANKNKQLFNIPLVNVSSNRAINQLKIVKSHKWKQKVLKSISQNYHKASYYSEVFPLIEKVFSKEYDAIANMGMYSIKMVLSYLGLSQEFINSSKLHYDRSLKGVSKIINICTHIGGKTYTNLPGAAHLYKNSLKLFTEAGLNLVILEVNLQPYSQFDHQFIPSLSIIDVLMFNSPANVKSLISNYKLLNA